MLCIANFWNSDVRSLHFRSFPAPLQCIAKTQPQPTSSIVASKPPQPAAPPTPAEPLVRPVPSPAPAAMKPDLPADRTRPAFCAWCGTVHAGGVDNCPKPVAAPVGASGADSTPASVKQEQGKEGAVREGIVTKPATPAAGSPVDAARGETKPEPAEVVTSLPLPAASVASEISAQSPATTKAPIPPRLRNPGQQEEDQGNDGCKNKQQSHTRSLRHRFDRLPAMRKRVFYLALNDVRRGMFVSAYPALRGCSRNSVQVGSSKPDTISPGGGQSQCQAFYYEVANLFRRRA